MGNHHSHEKKPRPKTEKMAVFPHDSDEFSIKFGMIPEMVHQPRMPPLVIAPAVPVVPPPPRKTTTMPRMSNNNRPTSKPLPPLPLQTELTFQPKVPPRSSSYIQQSPINRNNSSVSTKSLPTNRGVAHSTHQCDHDDRQLFIATHRFISEAENEINLEEGDQIYLVHPSTSDWWYVETKAKVFGFVPKSHIKQIEIHEPWFAGNIPRIVAVRRIMQPNLPVGTFLIRENPAKKAFVLTVRTSTEDYRSYEIFHQHGRFYMTDANLEPIIYFQSLKQLVHHFQAPPNSSEVHIRSKLTLPAPLIRDTDDENYITMRKWQINRDSVKLGKKIGSGQFGDVRLAKFENVDVAVKMMKEGGDEEAFNDFLQEAKFLSALNHPHLLRLLAVCTIQHPYYIITELMENGSLLDFLKLGVVHNKMTTESAMNIAAQVASGMSYLTANKFVHRDLAARNVLVGEKSSNHIPLVKVADFGLARRVRIEDENYDMSKDTKLAVKWMAPEGYNNKTFNSQTDVWSFGILIWEIGTMGETPYSEWSAKHTMKKVDEGYRLPQPDGVPDFVYRDAFLPCVDANPRNRPTFDQLFKYFDDDIRISQVKRSRTHSLVL